MENKCYICGTPLIGDKITEEHIIPNAIGGKLRSKKLLCKNCNSQYGYGTDAVLCKNLKHIVFLLDVNKDRGGKKPITLKDTDGMDITIHKTGKIEMSHPIVPKGDTSDGHIMARNEKELREILDKMIKRKTIKDSDAEKLLNKAKNKEKSSEIEFVLTIDEEAFPSIVRTAVSYYIERTNKYEDVKWTIPYIKGGKNCQDVLRLVIFETTPYKEDENQLTHMIHIEGSADLGVLYGLVEYFGLFTYVVLLNTNYKGEPINETYCYDVLSGSEVDRKFSLPIDKQWINGHPVDFKMTEVKCAAIEDRRQKIEKIIGRKNAGKSINQIINDFFKSYPEGVVITQEIYEKLCEVICQFLYNAAKPQKR